jgi:putative ABC transport system substrate-binding protein
MKKAGVLSILFVLVLLAVAVIAEAQQAKKVPRIGVLIALSPAAISARIEAFRWGLKELGYIEGKNIVIEERSAEGKADRLPGLAAELVRLQVDVIVAGGPAATGPAKEATSTIPIVMASDSDPVASGFVASLARPGGNITGLSTLSPELSGKQLELLKEIVPKLSRVAVIGNSTEPGNAEASRETQLAAGALGAQLQYLDVRDPKDIENALSAIKKERAGALIVLRNVAISTHRKRIVELAAKSRLPAMYSNREFIDAGGLMFYGASLSDSWRRAATFVDKILKGTKPAELPVEQPKKFELVINLKTAKQIGLTISPNVLARADKVIKF